MPEHKVGILTSGGLAPCLSSAVGYLIETYTRTSPETEIICYLNGYRGLLLGDSIRVTPKIRSQASKLQYLGGSPIGNSRVRLKNVKDCLSRNLIKENESPEHIAALQLIRDGITILHTIGGDDTNLSAGELSSYLRENFDNYKLSVIGLPKTIDNDVFPVAQTLGCQTAAEQGALFFRNVVAEFSSNPNMLIIHEIMGRNSGWLAAKTAHLYSQSNSFEFGEMVNKKSTEVHAVYIPEATFDVEEEVARLARVMEEHGCVNIFLSEGSCSEIIIEEMEKSGQVVQRDAFGHVRLDTLNPGKWFSEVIGKRIKAEKILVQKSGYFCRASPANEFDRKLVRKCAEHAVQYALQGKTGLAGPDQRKKGEISCIPYEQVTGGKPFDLRTQWFTELMAHLGQRVISLNHTVNPQFFHYDTNDSAANSGPNFSHLVSLANISLVSISLEESNAVQSLVKEHSKISAQDQTEICSIVHALMVCFKEVSMVFKEANFLGSSENVSSSISAMISSFFEKALESVKAVSAISFYENKKASKEFKKRNDRESNSFCVALDPIDGVSNINANISVGSIFGIRRSSYDSASENLCQRASDFLASGYCLYGAATILMLTFGQGVFAFTLDSNTNHFVLTHQKVKIPSSGPYYSVNEGYWDLWDEKLKEYILSLKKRRKQSLRYIGTFVADIHRTLLYGGIYLYPRNSKESRGKLDLVTECGPIAFLLDQAGGVSVDGNNKDLLNRMPESLEDKVAIVCGSKELVAEYIESRKSL